MLRTRVGSLERLPKVVSGSKYQDPNTKLQINTKLQAPKGAHWILVFGASLDLGSWCLDLGSRPTSHPEIIYGNRSSSLAHLTAPSDRFHRQSRNRKLWDSFHLTIWFKIVSCSCCSTLEIPTRTRPSLKESASCVPRICRPPHGSAVK